MDRYRQLDRDLAQKPYPAAGQDGLPAGAFQLASPAAGRGRTPCGSFSTCIQRGKRLSWRTKGDLAGQVSAKLAYILVPEKGILGWKADTWPKTGECVRRKLLDWRTQDRPQEESSAKQTLAGPGGGRKTRFRQICPPGLSPRASPYPAAGPRLSPRARGAGHIVRQTNSGKPGLANNRRDFGCFVRPGCHREPGQIWPKG